jgi:hypothetical protein
LLGLSKAHSHLSKLDNTIFKNYFRNFLTFLYFSGVDQAEAQKRSPAQPEAAPEQVPVLRQELPFKVTPF